ncbi:Cna B-type domain-containing protein [Blautia obeum]|uniref:Collagen adhesin n=1 Tax=Blautia obeum TaxID=40520 RepID=A0A564SUP7_9FIRM|nr:Cna B-type domain-containing protein [Blautia obeum]VUW98120.1 Collagen adhesin precursor [Blautia obeum]
MSKKLHSGLKRTLAWMLVVALMVQGCMVVYADDFSSEPEAVVSDESSDEDASAESDLEITEDEDTSADVEVSEDSDEDMDSDVTVEEEQEDEAGVDAFSDGNDVAAFSDGADAQDETDDLKVDIGNVDIAGGQQYSYSRLYDKDGYVRYAIGTYPANGSSLTLKVGDKRGMMYHALYTSTSSKYTDYKKASWSKVSGNHSSSIYSVEWSSDDESIAKVVSGSSYGPYTTGMWVQGVSEGTTTIRSTFIPGTSYKDKVKTVTNTFTVTVTKAAEQVNIGDTFTLEGTATTPYLTTKMTSTNVASLWGRTSEINYNASGDGLETAQASWKVWADTGIITHRFCINFGEMVGWTPQQSDNTTYTPSPSDSMSDKFLRPCVMPPDGIYITSVSSDKGSVVDGNVVFNKATGTSNYLNMYSYCISNQQKVDSATYYQNVQYTSSDETVVKKYKQDKYSVQLNALKAGTATLTASYQPVDENGDAVGDPITKDIKVIVCGFYIDEKAADGTNTIEMSLDDESITKKINYKVIDATGEGEATEPITWTVDNPTVASVDSDGVVKAKAAGETTVTAQYGDSSVNKDTVKIIVKGAGSLAFDKVESKIKKDGTDTIKATATYNGSTVRNADIKWESENPEIATVDGGKITGVGYGTTTVKASWTADNGKTYTNSAEVSVVYDGLYLSEAQNEVAMPQGSKQEIVWTIQNMGKYSKGSTGEGYNPSSDVTWKSNDETVATVDSAGVITACNLAEGETTASTTVTVSYKGIKVKDITVNVTENQNVVVNGDPVEIAGTKGESKTNSKGEDVTDTWKIGYHENGHGSLNAQFYGNGKDNIDIVSTEGAKVSVTGRTPSSGYIYLSHKYYVAAGNKQLCGVWQTIAIKVNGEAGLYLDKSSVSMKMGEADTATIMGTYIKADGTELGSDYWANKSNPKLSKLEMVDGDTSIVTAEADEKDGRLLHLTAVSPGKTTITIKCYPFEPTAICNVEVTSDARLVLTPADKLSVVQGDTATIEAKAWDGSAYVENPEITWQSYNTAIATVDDKGGVTGIKKGNVGVAATWNGVTSDPVQVTVVPSRNVSLTTEWNDSDNQDGSRPEKTTVQLTANGQPTGAPVELNADNNWTYEWKQLLAEDEEGTNIVYRVTADAPEDYTAKVTGSADDGFVVTYSHEIAKTSVTASVTWDDADDEDGIRPKSVSFQLKADGENVGDAITVNAGSNWTKTWEDLPEKKAGKALTYTVAVSDIPTEEDQYTVTTSGDAASGFVFKASHVSTSVEIPVSVTWDDAENQDGARIGAVEAELYANGEATGNKVTLNAENNWTAKFASVDVKKDGTRIKYEVKGTEADGYDVSVAGDILDEKGLVLTYKHIPAVVNVSARVSWNDANNQDGIRPTDTLVQLYADGTALGDKVVIESNKEWTKTWSNLPKYKAGKEIAYNMIAYAVSGYTVKVTGNALEGYKAEYTHNVQKMNVTVQNAWNDLDNVVDSRPAQLVVEIYANGKTTGKRVTLTEANNWKATVSGLDRNASGKRIQYAVKAVGTPAGYNISVSTDANGNIKLISNFTTYTKKLRLKLSKTSYIYNGKNAKPKVTVYNGRKKVSSKYYKVTYKNNKKVGYATVIVKGKGKFAKYAGKAAFTIKLKTLKKPSVKKGAKGTLNVSWKRDRQATKYVVQYSQSNKFKGKSTKTVTITNNKIGKTVLKGLTGKKNYYVRVRSCKAVNGRKIWSSWSSRSSKVKVK